MVYTDALYNSMVSKALLVTEKRAKLHDKIDVINANCAEADRDFTESEHNRILTYIQELDDLRQEYEDICKAVALIGKYRKDAWNE